MNEKTILGALLAEWAHEAAMNMKDNKNFIENRLSAFIRMCTKLKIKKLNKSEITLVYTDELLEFLKVSRQHKYYLRKINTVSIKTLEAIKNDL